MLAAPCSMLQPQPQAAVSHLGLKSLSQLMEHQRARQMLPVCFLPGAQIN